VPTAVSGSSLRDPRVGGYLAYPTVLKHPLLTGSPFGHADGQGSVLLCLSSWVNLCAVASRTTADQTPCPGSEALSRRNPHKADSPDDIYIILSMLHTG
jgi:hypothetical protein